jgi:hypothetical protein
MAHVYSNMQEKDQSLTYLHQALNLELQYSNTKSRKIEGRVRMRTRLTLTLNLHK